MLFRKQKMKEQQNRNSLYKRVQKVGIVTMLLTGVGLSSGFVLAKDGDSSFQTVFHVYSDSKYVGMVSDEKRIEQLKQEELEKAASEYTDLPLTIGTELSVVPERVFSAGTDDDEVLGETSGHANRGGGSNRYPN